MPSWNAIAGVLGPALQTGATGYLQAMNELPAWRLKEAKVKAEHELLPLETQATRAELQHKVSGAPEFKYLGPGIYAMVYKDGRPPEIHTVPIQKQGTVPKESAQMQHERLMLQWLQSTNPEERSIAQAWLAKLQAPGLQAKVRDALVQPHLAHLRRQEAYWTRMADTAAARNSAMAQRYRDLAQQASGEIRTLSTILEWSTSGTPEQRQAAENWLARKNLPITREPRAAGRTAGRTTTPDTPSLTLQEAQEQVNQLKGRPYFPGQSAKELEAITNLLEQLREQGKTDIGAHLSGHLARLKAQLERAEQREQGPARSSTSTAGVVKRIKKIGSTYVEETFRGAEAQLYGYLRGKFTGNEQEDAKMIAGILRDRDRYIARAAFEDQYNKALKYPEPVPSSTPGAGPTPAPGSTSKLSSTQITAAMEKVGVVLSERGQQALDKMLARFKKMPVAHAIQFFAAHKDAELKDAELLRAFKLAFLSVYQQIPPE